MEVSTIDKYLLSETAMEVWKTNDAEGQNKMLVCITMNCKEKWFKGFIYNCDIIPAILLEEFAEESFYIAWERFNKKGKAGEIKFTEVTYTGYLKQAVHRTFIKLYKKEIKKRKKQKEFGTGEGIISEEDDNQDDILQKKIDKTLNSLHPKNASIIKWRYMQKLSYTVIAQKLNILEKSCKQKLYRAKDEFIEIWNDNK